MEQKHTWPGGEALVTIEGTFLAGGGVSTSVELWICERQADGSLKRPVLLETFREPISRARHVPGGEYFWSAAGPEGQAWEVRARLDELPKRERPPTLADRVGAIEARMGNSGLNS